MSQSQVRNVQDSLAALKQIRLFRRGEADVVEAGTAGMESDTAPPGTVAGQSSNTWTYETPSERQQADVTQRVTEALRQLGPGDRLIPEMRPNFNLLTRSLRLNNKSSLKLQLHQLNSKHLLVNMTRKGQRLPRYTM